jgi:hypothetical protein
MRPNRNSAQLRQPESDGTIDRRDGRDDRDPPICDFFPKLKSDLTGAVLVSRLHHV